LREARTGQGGSTGAGHAAERHIVLVCHELTPAHRLGLVDGVIDLVIQTPIHSLSDTAVRVLLQALAPGHTAVHGQPHVLPFEIYTPENV
jgi:hypothetical protein